MKAVLEFLPGVDGRIIQETMDIMAVRAAHADATVMKKLVAEVRPSLEKGSFTGFSVCGLAVGLHGLESGEGKVSLRL